MSKHHKSLTRTLSNVAQLIDMVKSAPDLMECRTSEIKNEVRKGSYDCMNKISKLVEKMLKKECA